MDYYWLAILSMLGYSVQSTLMASIYRQRDPVQATALRGMSLAISMSPLLLWAEAGSFQQLESCLWALLLAAVTAAMGNWASALSVRYVPIGIATAFQHSSLIVTLVTIEALFYREWLNWWQYVAVVMIILGVSLVRNIYSTSTDKDWDVARGIGCAVVYGVFLAIAFRVLGDVVQRTDPLLAGYIWEVGIGFVLVAICLVRARFFGVALERTRVGDFVKILAYSAPTAIGTGCYAIAVESGPVAIVSAIVSTMVCSNALLSRILYREQLSAKQWFAIWICLVAVIILKLESVGP